MPPGPWGETSPTEIKKQKQREWDDNMNHA